MTCAKSVRSETHGMVSFPTERGERNVPFPSAPYRGFARGRGNVHLSHRTYIGSYLTFKVILGLFLYLNVIRMIAGPYYKALT